MFQSKLHTPLLKKITAVGLNINTTDSNFFVRLLTNSVSIAQLHHQLYHQHSQQASSLDNLFDVIINNYIARSKALKQSDEQKLQSTLPWFTSNQLAGMSLYVDRFCGKITNLSNKLDYLKNLGVNVLHLMPLFESPANESDGGYAVSNFRKVDERFGTIQQLQQLQQTMQQQGFYLMLDIVLNHTSHKHEWAIKAKQGDKEYQDFFYFFNDRTIPNQYELAMPEVFPESSPGSFTFNEETGKWVMTVFHSYQWDLNYSNPAVLTAMVDNILFYANLGVDILRIDAPAFIWKQMGTTCQNLPEAHVLLRLIKLCVEIAAPGMALLGEAIVAPKEIMKYFGTDNFTAHECDFAYNATHMALQWDALATQDVRVMLAAQADLLRKPKGCSWITYTRCHDDIGLGYEDSVITQASFNPFVHRMYLKNYYSGTYEGSPATGALFSFNPKTQDARISGSLSSLCGLESAINSNDTIAINTAINKIILMQAHSIFLGGLPMLYYGDEVGYTNDYSYLHDEAKSYDNRWMHRPLIDWNKNKKTNVTGSIEHTIFTATQQLLQIRKQLPAIADESNIAWITPHNLHVAAYVRTIATQRVFCLFNFSNQPAPITWYAFKEKGNAPTVLTNCITKEIVQVGNDAEHFVLAAYGYYIFEG
jgi:amylosucrase